jgi:DNA-binding winged helix-turn-helix (wHTH) protein
MAIYKIGNHLFNTLTRTITDDTNDAKKLSQSEVYLLAYLVENQGKVNSKNELMSIGWPKKVVVINSLTVAISNLRKALDNPDIISSNKGIGYTFSSHITIEHNHLDEIEDEDIIKNYDRPSEVVRVNSIVNFLFYLSIILFLVSSSFIINWFYSYVGR